MPVSPQSAALRSRPGYVRRPVHTSAYGPSATPPPTGLPDSITPPEGYGSAPQAGGINLLTGRLGKLGEKYNPLLTDAQAAAKGALSGYGGWSFQEDDPNTPEREDLLLDFDPNARLGEREKGAVREVRNSANAQGMLNSSFANQNIGSALQRMSLEAQQIATQYAGSINDIYNAWSGEHSSITTDLTNLYGEAGAWLNDRPPPTPVDPVQQAVDAAPKAGDGSPILWSGGTNYPNMEELRQKFPGQPLGVRRGGDGKYYVVAGQGNAQSNTAMPGQLWKGASRPSKLPAAPPGYKWKIEEPHGNRKQWVAKVVKDS